MYSKLNKKINSNTKILSKIKSHGKSDWLIKTSLSKKWKNSLQILNLHKKCCNVKFMDKLQLLLKTQSAISRINSETFKNFKHQSINVQLCSMNWRLQFKLKDNKSIQSKLTLQEQRIMLRKQRKNCKKQNNIINALKNVFVQESLWDLLFW